MHDLDVVVVGEGIGGLAAAIAPTRGGQRVRVVERSAELRPAGAGISLWPNGVKVLDALGLGPQIARVGGRLCRIGYRDPSGRTLCEFSLDPLVARVGEHPYPVRRAAGRAAISHAHDPGRTAAWYADLQDHDGAPSSSAYAGP